MKIRTGFGYDVHRLKEGLEFTLGGIKLNHTKGMVAHSDGDVLIHAICDALLGAANLGDIGLHFPDSSEKFKNIDSKMLLSRTCNMVQEEGYEISNIDCTVSLQKPKIKDYIPRMKLTLANICHIPEEDISVKATTTEKLGFIGKEEGVAAYASVLIIKSLQPER